jgi:hypothetical protein
MPIQIYAMELFQMGACPQKFIYTPMQIEASSSSPDFAIFSYPLLPGGV